MNLTIHPGQNQPFPMPIMPSWSPELRYKFRLSVDWWQCDSLTYPIPNFGLKLPAKGRFDYHKGGSNFGVIKEGDHIYLYPRYYMPISSGLNDNRELDKEWKIELKPDGWTECALRVDGLRWWVNGDLVMTKDVVIPKSTIIPYYNTPIFLGKGSDNNYAGGYVPKSGASRDLSMQIIFY